MPTCLISLDIAMCLWASFRFYQLMFILTYILTCIWLEGILNDHLWLEWNLFTKDEGYFKVMLVLLRKKSFPNKITNVP